MLWAWSSQYPHWAISPDQPRSIEVNGTGSVVVPEMPTGSWLAPDPFMFQSSVMSVYAAI